MPDEQPTAPPQNADGTPHLTYFIKEGEASFVWSGDFDQPIQMCQGGYGEPVTMEIRIGLDAFAGLEGTQPLVAIFERFKSICDNVWWIWEQEGGKDLPNGGSIFREMQ